MINENTSPIRSVTLEQVMDAIASETYFTGADGAFGAKVFAGPNEHGVGYNPIPAPLSLLTFCVLTLRNGYTVTGQSACADPQNYDAEIGRKIAKANAVAQVWPLLGYALRDEMSFVEELMADRDFMEAPGFEVYIGTKLLHAAPMSRAVYSDFRGWTMPADEEDDEGYLVEYTDGGTPNVKGYPGYVSWSPKAVFERAYTRVGPAGPSEREGRQGQSIPVEEPREETFVDRLHKERDELHTKVAKLEGFLLTPGYNLLPKLDQNTLTSQAYYMNGYLSILHMRLDQLTNRGV